MPIIDRMLILMRPRRYLHPLKKKVSNKARIEGSICEAYIIEEVSNFCSLYFDSKVVTNRTRVARNDDGGVNDEFQDCLEIFKHPGRYSGKKVIRVLSDREMSAITKYIYENCEDLDPFVV